MRKSKNFWNKETSFEAALEFTNKRDFKLVYMGAYEFLRKNKLLDDACEHMQDLSHIIKWDYEKCKEVALKCNTKTEFKEKYSWAFTVSKNNDWFNELTSHMVKNKCIKPTKYTKEICQKEALKYKNKKDFYKKSTNEYNAAIRNNWLSDICIHMDVPYANKYKWTKEMCSNLAIKYIYRIDFQKHEKNAYSAAKYNGWLDEICTHMEYKKLPNNYWNNFDNCKKEALKYTTKKDFYSKSEHTYNMALKNGWIDDICKHMLILGSLKDRCIYSYEFPDNHVYVGLTYNIVERNNGRKRNANDSVTKYINETKLVPKLKQLTEYIKVDDAIILEGKYLTDYIKNGWIPLNKVKTGGIGGHDPWSFNRIKSISAKYSSENELMVNDNFIYKIAKNKKWLEKLFFI